MIHFDVDDMRGAGEYEMDDFANTVEPSLTLTEHRSLFYPREGLFSALML